MQHETPAGPSDGEVRAGLLQDARALRDALDKDPAGARPDATRVVATARALREPEPLAWGLRALAVLHRHDGDPAAAETILGEAIRVARRAHLPVVGAWLLASRSVARLELGRTAQSRSDALAALRVVDERGGNDPDLVGLHLRLQLQLAVMDHNSGRLTHAEERYRTVAREAAADSADLVRAANNLALVLVGRAEYSEALLWAQAAVDGAARLGPALRSWPYLTRSLIEVHTGRLAQGLRDLDAAARALQEAGQSPGEYYLQYAETMRELRLLPEAAAAGRRALEEIVGAGADLLEVDARISLAETLLLAGDAEQAAEHAAVVRERARRQGRPGAYDRAVLVSVQALTRLGRAGAPELASVQRAAMRLTRSGELAQGADAHLVGARVAAALGAHRRAVARYDAAADLARGGPLSVRLRGRIAAALAARLRGLDDALLAECRAGLRDLARHRATLPTMELRALASGHGAELGELGLDVVVRRGSPAAVLRWMEQTRGAALELVPAGAGTPVHVSRPAARAPREVPGPGPARRGSVIVADDDLAADTRRSAWLEDVSSGGSATLVPGLGTVRRALGGRVLVEYGRYGDRVVAVVVDAARARVVDLGTVAGLVAGTLQALVFALRRMVDPSSRAAAEAARASADLRIAQLRAVLVAPLGVRHDDELVVVPVGVLHGAPWSALHDGPVALAPSATAWMRTLARAPDPGMPVVLVAGPDLRGAGDEVEALRALHPAVRVLGAAQSRADAVVAEIGRAELAHLACHGALRSDNPMFSSVVLADGPVTVQELHRAGVAPRRLVLASCHSGADVAYEGDEVLGLVSAMLSRGTAGVVASIAAVPDVEVVDLMLALHRRLAVGQTMARALHGARGEIDRDTPAGFVNWCTFSAHGAA
ncbi:CHAT domain-containing protein [Cellulomonas dongxiuzhuiae]|uniref:CHAT domain-containing protein n=1 Tax=Cellulomonas dongxiuzhuiae TaxID=2819979 RepID=A0ABX8GJ45_9CELL|nr:CHAT domain-containing protein [Cellulomonas dongxiuzhuiae]MBO3094223.1 CHAT domain-containing protein [Cellulomonas dongxiuzhuiae]QWC15274.1 CHAT domain-containing protein [Cellulomonas dongxiuzhuiae]